MCAGCRCCVLGAGAAVCLGAWVLVLWLYALGSSGAGCVCGAWCRYSMLPAKATYYLGSMLVFFGGYPWRKFQDSIFRTCLENKIADNNWGEGTV